MSQYRIGTVNVSNGTTTVLGIGTSWVGNVGVGSIFKIEGIRTSYEIDSVISDSCIRLRDPYANPSVVGGVYHIHRDFTPGYNIPEINEYDRDWTYYVTKGLRKVDSLLSGGSGRTALAMTISATSLYSGQFMGITAKVYDSGSNSLGSILTGTGAKADADAISTLPGIAIAVTTNSVAGYYTCLIHGIMRKDNWNFPASKKGYPVYVDVTAGGVTTTALTTGKYQQIIGVVVESTPTSTLYFKPGLHYTAM
jgi:hypothetical protein